MRYYSICLSIFLETSLSISIIFKSFNNLKSVRLYAFPRFYLSSKVRDCWIIYLEKALSLSLISGANTYSYYSKTCTANWIYNLKMFFLIIISKKVFNSFSFSLNDMFSRMWFPNNKKLKFERFSSLLMFFSNISELSLIISGWSSLN